MRVSILASLFCVVAACNQVHPFSDEERADIDCLAAITVVTDSAYVKNGVTGWIFGWKRNGWKTANKKAVKNADLWQMLDQQVSRHQVEWDWVKGHSGHPENERVDQAANDAIDAMQER